MAPKAWPPGVHPFLQFGPNLRNDGSTSSRLNHSQLPDLARIPRLNVVPLRLPRVACNDGKVGAGNGEDGAAVVRVRVEPAERVS